MRCPDCEAIVEAGQCTLCGLVMEELDTANDFYDSYLIALSVGDVCSGF